MNIASYIDHTILKPDATLEQIDRVCAEAREHHFAAVCVNGCWVSRCTGLLQGSGVKVCSVIGFPLGAMATAAKCFEAEGCVRDGASEIDMVLNIGALKSGKSDLVRSDIRAVAETCHKHGAFLKVILETALLSQEEKVQACRLCEEGGADFVKTSTGFGGGGASLEDVALMRKTVGKGMSVKASGGIRDYQTAKAMIEAGASRIGASASVRIVSGE